MPSDEGVGYGRPPKNRRFKPGQSGNPGGRPKASSFRSDLAAELREEIVLRDKTGRPRKITRQKALIHQLFECALENDRGAIGALLACMRQFGVGYEEAALETTDLEDVEMIKEYLKRTEARAKLEKVDSSSKSQDAGGQDEDTH